MKFTRNIKCSDKHKVFPLTLSINSGFNIEKNKIKKRTTYNVLQRTV